MMRTLVLVALAACSIKPIDYTGKQCPCPDGYTCNLITQTCARDVELTDANRDATDGPRIDAPGMSGVSCLANPRSQMIYSSTFTEFPTGWLSSLGQWTKQGPELQQTNANNTFAFASHTVSTSMNYRVVATLRQIGPSAAGSVGIGLRLSGGQGNGYACAINMALGAFTLSAVQSGGPGSIDQALVSINDTNKTITMEMDATGSVITCCIRDVADAELDALNTTFTAGNIGVVTLNSQGAFSSIAVYQ